MISVLVLTLNEEANLARCLDSVRWSDDIVVLDSFSTDRTVEIAAGYGARVLRHRFGGERSQREAGLRIPFKHAWVYNPDADEVATPELREEMFAAVQDQKRPEAAYRMRFKTMFMGRWVKHSSLYPTWVIRLIRPERISFERSVNLQYLVDGLEGRLKSHFEHYSFNNGLNAWFDKHNRYSWSEAEESLQSLSGSKVSHRALVSGNPAERRRALKELSFRLPCRPLLRFLYMYVARLGFLDGIPGYHYCRLLSIYEYMIVLKMKEIWRREQGLPW